MTPTRMTTMSLLVLAGAIPGATFVATSASAEPRGLHLVAHQDLGLTVIPCDQCILHPVGFNPGDHIGEFLVNSGTLTHSNGTSAGRYAAHIVGTTVAINGSPEVQLTGTLSLPAGQITFQGLEEPPTNGGTIAITGGTGRYRSARGELRFRDRDETTTDMDVILK